eukprot:SM000005S17132  [mRNA]  locus=s5:354830:362126:+ [translate_table: standard]
MAESTHVLAGGSGEAAGNEQGGQYKDTVDLPRTSFGMRANAAVREPEIQRLWEDRDVLRRIVEANTGDVFTLHDGPPYANGDLHCGHALNKILKDFINRYQLMQGRKVRYVPGWDCHGLPIELKVLQSMDAEARKGLTTIKLRKKAAQFALKTVDKQRQSFKRFGVWGDWDEPYLTLKPQYEAAQIGVFGKMVLNGHIYRGRKPVHWSPSSGTALAEAELEYPEAHTSRSIYAAFKLVRLSEAFPDEMRNLLPQLGLAIWTTTPWTIPGNAAVAVNDRLTYAVVRVQSPPGGDAQPSRSAEEKKYGKGAGVRGNGLQSERVSHLIVAEGLVGALQGKWGVELATVGTFPGSALEHCQYEHPLEARQAPVVIGGDYITTESGTGLVHTAPGHGQDDYITGLKYGLPLLSPVDDAGVFTPEAGDEFAGKEVLGSGNVAVIQALDRCEALLMEEAYVHKYPYDWRTKLPTIFRATEQWFASVEGFRQAALDAIASVTWIPPTGEKRITSMTLARNDWCISRQRSWGVPIPVFYHVETGEPLMNQSTIAHIQSVIAEKGSDAWFQLPVEDLLPEEHRAAAVEYCKGTDTMDVWFDSGSSWAAVVEQRPGLSFPADLYLEGSDQHRGWFQSSLLTSVATHGRSPYKKVLTHGFVLDEKGLKMSKSLGNVIDPALVIEGGKNQKEDPAFGADVLRLWVASVDYTGDVLIGPKIIRQMADVYRKLRGTLRYLLGNLHDFQPDALGVAYEDLPGVDRYALWRLASLLGDLRDSYESYQFYRFFQLVQRYAVVDLSNFYFDICKDRLYVGGTDSHTRRSCQTVLMAILLSVVRVLAPVLPHLAEDAWSTLPFPVRSPVTGQAAESVFETGWPAAEDTWLGFPAADQAFWQQLLQVRAEANRALEAARAGRLIGASLEAKVLLHMADCDAGLEERLRAMAGPSSGSSPDRLCYLFLTSQVEMVSSREAAEKLGLEYVATAPLESGGDVWVGVARADGAKCERCWNHSPGVGSFADHPTLCERCHAIVAAAPTNVRPVTSPAPALA